MPRDIITKREVERAFERLLKQAGLPKSHNLNSGGYDLDYIACYGGYIIVKYLKDGGESEPFGFNRMKARAMFNALNLASGLLDEIKREVTK